VDGILVKDFLNKAKEKEIEKVCFEIGRMIGKLHGINIVHGDLTTSNMILKDNKIYFIDFGLGEFSERIEDKAVDLRLLHDAINATHSKILKLCWDNILKGYKKEYKNAKEVLFQLEKIKKRVRYAKR
jgi:Kae1-associated kinase Bud32